MMDEEIKTKLVQDLKNLLEANKYVIMNRNLDQDKIALDIFNNLLDNYNYYHSSNQKTIEVEEK